MKFFEFSFLFSIFFVFYTYIGYPLFISVVAIFFRHTKVYSPYFPFVTLLITAYNEEDVISRKLDQSLKLDYPRDLLEIIVAADGSDDNTVNIVKGFATQGVKLSYDSIRKGKMSAINRAMAMAKGEVIIFSDANNDYSNDVIYKMVEPYADPLVGAVTGSKSIYKEDSSLSKADGLYWKYEAFIKLSESRVGCCLGVSGEIFSIRKSIFSPPPARIINDDFYMAMDVIKKGYNIAYSPLAQSFEKISQNAQDEITRRTRIFTGQVQLFIEEFFKLPFNRPLILFMMLSHKFCRILLPLAMIFALVFNALILFFGNTVNTPRLFTQENIFLLLCLQVLFYLSAILGMSRFVPRMLKKILYIPTFLVNSNLAAFLGIIKYFTGSQTAIWKKVSR